MTHAHWPPGLPQEVWGPQTSLYYNLEVSARRYADKPAIIYYGRAIPYSQLKREVDALAGYLHRRCAVRRGDRVVLYMQNSPQFVIAYYAILRADAVVVPVNPMNLGEELRHIVTDSGANTALLGQEVLVHARPLLGQELAQAIVATYSDYLLPETDLPVPEVARAAPVALEGSAAAWRDAVSLNLEPPPHTAGPDDPAVIPYSSGTTGAPKGCLHAHRSVMHTAIFPCEWLSAAKDSVILASLPMFHVTGMQAGMNAPIYLGATAVVMTRWDKRGAAELIERYRVSGWSAISTMLIDFLNQPDLAERDLTSLQRLSGGGAAMPAAVAQQIESRWGLKYLEGYGLSETIATTHLNPPHRPKPQCLGIPIQGTTSLIVDPDTLEPLPTGTPGEILIHGPQVFRGYWGRPDASAAAFVEIAGQRFLRTGDLGYVDDEGYFFMVDRLKRMINAAGYKVWPAEVETLLHGHPAVLEACVIATHDAHRGESVKALVVLRPGQRIEAQELIDWAHEHMAAYKVPRVVEFVEALPKSATGKPLWRSLQERELARATHTAGNPI
jgi:fatty-acyl-CoA synthase